MRTNFHYSNLDKAAATYGSLHTYQRCNEQSCRTAYTHNMGLHEALRIRLVRRNTCNHTEMLLMNTIRFHRSQMPQYLDHETVL